MSRLRPSRVFLRAAVAALGLLLAPPFARAATHSVPMEPGARSTISLITVSDLADGPGFFPLKIRVENRAPETRRWTVHLAMNHYTGVQTTAVSSYTIEVPASLAAETVVYLPLAFEDMGASHRYSNGIATIDGPDVQAAGTVYINSSGGSRAKRGMAATSGLEEMFQRYDREAKSSAASGSRPTRGTVFSPGATILNAAEWPADWRVWSMFELVMFTNREWEQLDTARRNALRDWVAQGGTLVLVPEEKIEESTTSHGHGAIRQARFPVALLPRIDCQHYLDEANNLATKARTHTALPVLNPPGDPITLPFRGGRWLVGFVIVFALAAGPLNLFWFAPPGKRHRLFFTMPILAVAGSLLLGVIILLGDGMGGTGARQAIVLLLPADNRAVVQQRQMVRTGLLARREFPAADDTQISFLSAGQTMNASLNFERRDGVAGGDWFNSRAIQGQNLQRLESTRARVEVTEGVGNGRGPVVVSSVGTTLTEFIYRDSATAFWTASEVTPGKSTELTKLRDLTAVGNLPAFQNGWFRAKGGASDLAPIATLGSIRWEERGIVYTGPVISRQAAP